MDAKIFRVNYKSDFILTLISDAGWMTPFCIKFWTGAPSQAYYAQYDGTTYTNCAPVAGEPTKLTVQFDDHHMPIGNLKYQVAYHFTVADFPNDTEDEVLNQANITTEIDGETYQVMLDFTGETAPEIQFSLPAYANEAKRIANELQREANELQREANEEDREDNELNRQRNEGTRIENERERVQEFQQMKGELEQATRDASAAAENANEKAVYAKNQGDYAKQQGDYAKDQGDIAKADHLRAEEDHRVAGEDHTQAGNDHTRAGEDHTQAGNDHTRAGEDHTQAGNDHTRAGEDHTRAESDHAAVEVYVDSLGVFDLSKHNAVGGVLATYADLNAALTALNALESKYKYGGMSMKFVQSSDNKYVQYRCIANEFTTDTTQWTIAEEGVYVENPEFVYVETDNEDKIVWAIKTDGSIYYGAGVPQQIIDYIEEKIADLSLDKYEDIVAFLSDYLGSDTTLKAMIDGINASISNLSNTKVDKEEGKSLINAEYASTQSAIENPEFLEITTDLEGKILAGRTPDGAAFENVGFSTPKVSIDGTIIENIDDPEGRTEIKTDFKGRILSYRDSDGLVHEEVGIEPKSIKMSLNSSNDVGEALKLHGYINSQNLLPRIYVTSDFLYVKGNDIVGLDITKNEVACRVSFITKEQTIVDENCLIAYQGNSTLANPKKGFTIDFSKEYRIANWLAFDSFHIKGYYIDWLHIRDWLANQIIEQTYHLRPIQERRPFMKYNNFSSSEVAMLVDAGPLCHTDEIPAELFINGVYWGLYSFRIKKSRSNYMLKKKDKHHIQIEAANDAYYTNEWFADGGTGWGTNDYGGEYIEIRNPNKDSGNRSFDVGVEPNRGEVKVAWQTFIQRLNAITVSTTKAQLETFLNIQEWIDAILLYNIIGSGDIWCKNTLYTCWDSNVDLDSNTVSGHWSPLLYDFDGAFTGKGQTDPFEAKAYGHCPWLSILQTIIKSELDIRYKELRDNKVFDYDNLEKIVESRIKEIGTDEYRKDIERWNNLNTDASFASIMNFINGKLTYMDNIFNYS